MARPTYSPFAIAAIALCALPSTGRAQIADRAPWSAVAATPRPMLEPSHASRVLTPGERPVLIPTKPTRSSLNKHLLIGTGVGALLGSVAYWNVVRNRCVDCWSWPHIEVPVYVGGGALAGYAVGGVVYLLRVAPKKGDAPRD